MFYPYLGFILYATAVLSSNINISSSCGDHTECIRKGCCKTLHYVFKSGANLNGTALLIEDDQSLTERYMLKNLHNFSMLSLEGRQLTGEGNSGLFFLFAEDITISNLNFTNCGVEYTSTTVGFTIDDSTGPFNISEAVRFVYSHRISLRNLNFVRNNGIALSIYDSNGKIEIENCNFDNNTNFVRDSSQQIVSGGGIHIEYSPCGTLHPFNCSIQDSILRKYSHDAYINIIESIFKRNIAMNSTVTVAGNDHMPAQQHISFGMGGAVALYLLGNSSRNNITINNCDMTDNVAHWGGAVAVTIRHSSDDNIVILNNNKFVDNEATYGGGAMRIHRFVNDQKYNATGVYVRMENLHFNRNAAIWGGAISIAGTTWRNYREEDRYRDTLFSNCTFTENKATVGYAVGLSSWGVNSDASGPGIPYRVVFNNTKFERNQFKYSEDQRVIGHGALYADKVVVVFYGNNTFLGNSFTALALTSSSLNFESDSVTVFEDNTGNEGGAIAMYGSSWIRLLRRSQLVFKGNTALTKGGAIYYKFYGPPRLSFQTTQLQTAKCFLRYEDGSVDYDNWQTNISFINNKAASWSGSSVFASTLQFCRGMSNSRDAKKAFNWSFVTFTSVNKTQPEVVTTAVEIEVNPSDWNVVPGMAFSPKAVLLDEKQQSVYGTVEIDIELPRAVSLSPQNNRFLIKDNFRELQLDGKENTGYSFRLKTTSGQFIMTPNFTSALRECLLGFRQKPNTDECTCMKDEYSDVLNCDKDGTVYLLKGKWGYRNSKSRLLETHVCPDYYCSCNTPKKDDHFKCIFNVSSQCAPGREGKLCSRCKPGLSVRIGNDECSECSNYYILLLIPAVVVLSFVVIVVLYFNFNAFSGYLNAFLYSYQMMMLLVPDNVELDPFISYVIGITSLSGTGGIFGFCFFDGMDNLQKIGIDYIIPSYMSLFTVFLGMAIPSRMYQRMFSKRSANNVEPESVSRARSFGSAMSFMLVISYSSFTKVTFNLLNCVEIDGESVLFRAAFARCFASYHIGYGILAIFVFIFIVLLLPIILLFTRNFTFYFQRIQRLEPIWNTLKDCFRDRSLCRMFAAYYFICRLILLALNVFLNELINRLVCMNIANLMFLVIFLSVQPYKQWTYNLWDTIILADMCFISLLSLVVSMPYAATAIQTTIYEVILKIAVYLPFIIVVLRLFYYFYETRKNKNVKNPGRGSPVKETKSGIAGRIQRWKNGRNSKIAFPERVVEDFDTDYVEFK